MGHIISFRRPDLRHVLSKMFVPPQADVATQVRRLHDLGYQIVDVTPPFDGYVPTPPTPPPKLSLVDEATAWFRRDMRR